MGEDCRGHLVRKSRGKRPFRCFGLMPNWVNRTLWTGDNLPIMRGMNSESVDLIYLDPPFNSKKTYSA